MTCGAELIVMLGGGSQSTQAADISWAAQLAVDIEERSWVRRSVLPTFPSSMRPNISTARAIAEYLTAMIEDGDPALLAAALGDIARRGMTELAKVSGIGRAAL